MHTKKGSSFRDNRDTRGNAAVEYVLLASSISLAILLSLGQVSSSVKNSFCMVSTAISGLSCDGAIIPSDLEPSSRQWFYKTKAAAPSQEFLALVQHQKDIGNKAVTDDVSTALGGSYSRDGGHLILSNSDFSGQYLSRFRTYLSSVNGISPVLGVSNTSLLQYPGSAAIASSPSDVMAAANDGALYVDVNQYTTFFTQDGSVYRVSPFYSNGSPAKNITLQQNINAGPDSVWKDVTSSSW